VLISSNHGSCILGINKWREALLQNDCPFPQSPRDRSTVLVMPVEPHEGRPCHACDGKHRAHTCIVSRANKKQKLDSGRDRVELQQALDGGSTERCRLLPGELQYATIETDVYCTTIYDRGLHAGLPHDLSEAEKVAFIAKGYEQHPCDAQVWTFDTHPRGKWDVTLSNCEGTEGGLLVPPLAKWNVIRHMTADARDLKANNDASLAAWEREQDAKAYEVSILKDPNHVFSTDARSFYQKKEWELTWGKDAKRHGYLCRDLEASKKAWDGVPIGKQGKPLLPRRPWEDEPFPGHDAIPRRTAFRPARNGQPNLQTPGRSLSSIAERCRVTSCPATCYTRICEKHADALREIARACTHLDEVRLKCDKGRSYAYYHEEVATSRTEAWSGIQFRPPCPHSLNGPFHSLRPPVPIEPPGASTLS
jgi:hypothetical protein